jgi:L-arabinokinase
VVVIVFYISGHGLGHASRDIEVINTILERRPDIRIVVRTSAPRWFFDTFVRGPVEMQPVEVDTGVTQIDSLRLDEADTARRAADFYGLFAQRVAAEVEVLAQLGASVVVADIPPLAIAAAAGAGIPSVAIGNFTWDWIYSGYPPFERLAPGVIEIIAGVYGRATRTLRLPFHGGFDTMTTTMRDIPLVARHARHPRGAVRRTLGLADDEVVVLASFGGYGLQLPYEDIAQSSRFTLVVTDREVAIATGPPAAPEGIEGPLPRLRRFEIADLARRGFHYPDLVAAADVVVSKPGYGIVSECIANGASLLYTDRGRFVEHEIFVAEMPRVLRCRFIPQDDLMAGRWDDAVSALGAQGPPPDHLATNGADAAAQEILEIADF